MSKTTVKTAPRAIALPKKKKDGECSNEFLDVTIIPVEKTEVPYMKRLANKGNSRTLH